MAALLLKGGEVIDPAQNVKAKLDAAATGGIISVVAPNIGVDTARRVLGYGARQAELQLPRGEVGAGSGRASADHQHGYDAAGAAEHGA